MDTTQYENRIKDLEERVDELEQQLANAIKKFEEAGNKIPCEDENGYIGTRKDGERIYIGNGIIKTQSEKSNNKERKELIIKLGEDTIVNNTDSYNVENNAQIRLVSKRDYTSGEYGSNFILQGAETRYYNIEQPLEFNSYYVRSKLFTAKELKRLVGSKIWIQDINDIDSDIFIETKLEDAGDGFIKLVDPIPYVITNPRVSIFDPVDVGTYRIPIGDIYMGNNINMNIGASNTDFSSTAILYVDENDGGLYYARPYNGDIVRIDERCACD